MQLHERDANHARVREENVGEKIKRVHRVYLLSGGVSTDAVFSFVWGDKILHFRVRRERGVRGEIERHRRVRRTPEPSGE